MTDTLTQQLRRDEPWRDYMARFNRQAADSKPFCVIDSYVDKGKARKFTGQGKPLAIRHESGERFKSAKDAERRFDICAGTILKYARLGQPTRVGMFYFVEAA